MGLQIFDDGSSIATDSSGAVTSVTNSAGVPQYVPPPDGSAVMQEFSALFSQGAQAIASTVTNKLKGSLAGSSTPSGTPQSQAAVFSKANVQKYLPAVLLAVAIVAGFHYLKR